MHPAEPKHLPMWPKELSARGWSELDVLLISGDDYFDSPTHGVAVIGRVLEEAGYRVGIITRPDWKHPETLRRLGTPRLFVGIGAGAVDSTLNNYTADLAPRKIDAYAAKESFSRPNFATAVYCGMAKGVFTDTPIVLGGVEASTRRFAYFDYLQKKIRRSVLVDTRANLLVYGSGEKAILEIAARLRNNQPLDSIRGTAQLTKAPLPAATVILPAFAELQASPSSLIAQTRQIEQGLGPHKETTFAQQYNEGVVVAHPPALLTGSELDSFHELPFLRTAHPSYQSDIPAASPVRWSVIAQRGCPGACSFCALSYHQGREVISRSEASVLLEIERFTQSPDFSGTVSDVGGPTANAYGMNVHAKQRCIQCQRVSCFHPNICDNLVPDQERFTALLRTAAKLPGVRHLFVASGIRHDLALRSKPFIAALARQFTGGHLKVAPEHTNAQVLKRMRKPPIEEFEKFERLFSEASSKIGKEQYVVPYFIAGFPGCTADAADESGKWLQRRNQRLQQVQNFIPLPGTMAAAMYASSLDDRGKALYIPDAKERRRQKELLLGKSTPRTTAVRRPTQRAGKKRKQETHERGSR